MAGRKAKPTALKLLQGNPGKRPINENEPKPKGKAPECPPQLDATARRIWNSTVKKLNTLGLITELDEALMANYCQSYSYWLQLTKDVKKEGQFKDVPILDKETGEPVGYVDGKPITETVKNPKVVEARLLLVHIRAVASEFGMSPSSRAKLSIEPPEEDEMKEFLSRNNRQAI